MYDRAENFSMNNWPVEYPLSISSLKSRIDISRMQAYEKFITCIAVDDFYFADILNIFLSCLQQPVNFVIFDKDMRIITHFCNDKEHYENFERSLEKKITDWGKSGYEKLFPIFPSLGLEYFLCPVFMQTKNHGEQDPYVFIEGSNSLSNSISEIKKIEELVVSDEKNNREYLLNYIRICTWLYFSEEWDAHRTYFSGKYYSTKARFSEEDSAKISAKKMVIESIKNISNNKKFPPNKDNNVLLNDLLSKTNFPNNTEGYWKGNDWRTTIQKALHNPIMYRQAGLELLSGMHHPLPLKYNDNVASINMNTLNMLLCYRSFTRNKEDKGRYYNEVNGGYHYDASYFFPNKNEEPDNYDSNIYLNYFLVFKQKYRIENEYDNIEEGRCFFRNILNNMPKNKYKNSSEKIEWYKEIALYADRLFWDKINENNGHVYIINTLLRPESDNVRNICDPVFSTGLIQFNTLFQYFGFDRIIDLDGEKGENIGKKIKDIKLKNLNEELIRAASFYYLFSGMASWSNTSEAYKPENLSAVLIPIKIKGVIWGVGIHATYLDSPNLEDSATTTEVPTIFSYHRQPTWMFINLLTTSLSKQYTALIDKALWGNTSARVSNVIRKKISGSNNETFYKAIEDASLILQAEHRLVPYSLPVLSFQEPDIDRQSDGMHGSFKVGSRDNHFYIYWFIEDNMIFRSHQSWAYIGTRNFTKAVTYGIEKGLIDFDDNTITNQ